MEYALELNRLIELQMEGAVGWVSNLTEAAEGVATNKGELFSSFDVNAFEVPGGRDELWRFTLLRAAARPARRHRHRDRTRRRHGDRPAGCHRGDRRPRRRASRSDRRAGGPRCRPGVFVVRAGHHRDRCARHRGGAPTIKVVIDGPGEAIMWPTGTREIPSRNSRGAIVVVDLRGSGTYADNLELIVAIWRPWGHLDSDWADDMVHVSAHHAKLGRDARFGHVNVTLGGDVVRTSATCGFTAPGGEGAAAGHLLRRRRQFFESRLLVDHAVPNRKSDVLYKGCAAGSEFAEARCTPWIGDADPSRGHPEPTPSRSIATWC